jgi:hypothetical protein
LARRACRGAAVRCETRPLFRHRRSAGGALAAVMCGWVTVDAVALPRARPARAAAACRFACAARLLGCAPPVRCALRVSDCRTRS